MEIVFEETLFDVASDQSDSSTKAQTALYAVTL